MAAGKSKSAGASAEADVTLLFGVAGGGSVSGDSGKKIKSELESIVKTLNESPLTILIEMDEKQKSQNQMKKSIKEVLDNLSDPEKKNFGITISNIKIDKKVKTDLVSQINEILKEVEIGQITAKSVKVNGIEVDSTNGGAIDVSTTSGKSTSTKNTKSKKSTTTNTSKNDSGININNLDKITSDLKNVGEAGETAKEKVSELSVELDNLTQISKAVESAVGTLANTNGTDEELLQIKEISQKYTEWIDKVNTLKNDQNSATIEAVQNLEKEGVELGRLAQTTKEGFDTSAITKQNKEITDNILRLKQTREITEELASAQANLQNWGAAKNGVSSESYKSIQDTVIKLQELQKEVESNSISYDQAKLKFDEYVAEINNSSAKIKAAGKDTQASADLEDARKKTAELNVAYRELNKEVTAVNSAMASLEKAGISDEEVSRVNEVQLKYNKWLVDIEMVKSKQKEATTEEIQGLKEQGKGLEELAAKTESAFKASSQKEYVQQLKLVKEITDEVASAQTNLQGWSAAKNGTSSGDYTNIQDTITKLKDLKTEVENNAISYDEARIKYEQFVAQINASSANISMAGENILSNEDLDRINTKAAELKIAFDDLKTSVSSVEKEITALEQASETLEEKQEVEDLKVLYDDWCIEVQKLMGNKANASVEAVRNLEEEGNEYQKIASIIKDTFNSSERERNIQQIKEEAQQLKQEAEITKAIADAQKNLQNWTAAENGISSGEYQNIKDAVTGLEELKKELQDNAIASDEAKVKYQEYVNIIKSSSIKISENGENKKTAQELDDIKQKAAEVKNEFKNLSEVTSSVKKAMESLNGAKIEEAERKEVAAVNEEWNKWKLNVEGLRSTQKEASVEEIQNLEEIGREIQKNAEETEKSLNSTKDKEAAKAEEERIERLKQEEKITKAIADAQKNLQNWGAAKNGKSSSSYSDIEKTVEQLEDLRAKLESGEVTTEQARQKYNSYAADLQKSESTIKMLGEDHKTLAERISEIGSKLKSYLSLQRVIRETIQVMRQMISAVEDIDSAMAQLQIVTGATDTEMTKFLTEATELAKELGQSITGILGSIETFSRLGYNLEDASSLAEYAAILSNVADTTVEEATTGLTAIIKGYNMDVSDAEHVADVLVEVGQKYAISASELMEAFERSGAAMNASNTGFEESAAIYAAANASVQNASTIGTALKTVSARIRGSTTELSELGEETEELANGFSKYAKELKALTGVDILEEGTTDTYKNIYQIFSELSKVWDELSDTQQSRASEILGGTRQLQVISSILSNWDDAAGAYADAMESAGVATEANAIYMDTINAHIEQFKVEFQALSYDLIDSSLIKGIVDIGAALLSMLDSVAQLISKMGGLKTVLVAVAGVIVSMKIRDIIASLQLIPDALNSIKRGLSKVTNSKYINSFKALGAGIKSAATGSDEAKANFEALGGSMSALSAGLSIATLAFTSIVAIIQVYKKRIEEARQATIDAGESAKELSQEITDLTSDYLELYESTRDTEEEQEEFSNLQDEIIEKLGLEQYQVNNLTEEYKGLENAVLGAAAAQLEQNARDTAAEASEYERQLLDTTNGIGFNKTRTGYIEYKVGFITDEANQKAFEELEKAGYVFSTTQEGNKNVVTLSTDQYDTSTIEGVIAAYNELNDMMTLVAENVGVNNSVYEALKETYNSLKDTVANYTDSVSEANNALIQSEMLETLARNGVPETEEEFEEYRQHVMDLVGANEIFIGSEEDIADAVDSVLSKEATFADFYVNEAEEILENGKVYAGQYDDLAEILSNISSAYSVLETAEQEMAEGNGLSADTINSLASATSDYLDYLYEENGVIKLNTEAWKNAADASMLGNIAGIEDEIEALNDRNDVLQEQIETLGEEASLDEENTQKLKEYTEELEDNNDRLEENQRLLGLYKSAYDGMTYTSPTTDSDLLTTLSTMESMYSVLAQAESDMAETGGLSASTISSIADATEDYMDYLYTENGLVKLNISAWRELSNEQAKSDISGLQENVDALKGQKGAIEDLINEIVKYRSFGNVDLNTEVRVTGLEWNESTIKEFQDELNSWGITVEVGDVSRTMGMTEEFEGTEIAFTPMLETDNGLVVLDKTTVDDYITEIVQAAKTTYGENWQEGIFELDATGAMINGQYIQGIIADIGETAISTGEAMEYFGDAGWSAIDQSAIDESSESIQEMMELTNELYGEEIKAINGEISALEDENAALEKNINEYREMRDMRIYEGNIDEAAEYAKLIDETTAEIEENKTAIEGYKNELDQYMNFSSIDSGLNDLITELGDVDQALLNSKAELETWGAAFVEATSNATFDLIDNVTETLTTIADLQEAVADSFTMSIDKALEFAEVYPEILNNATVAADGQIALDENVVNAFIEGKQAEQTAAIDEQIAELEADKEVLEAKLTYAEAELDLAEQVALGESEEEKALAEYRIQTGNAITEAMIDCGIDEATAFALAAAAMADDWDEYNRIATQVCTDMDGNFDTAAYDMALALYNNCKDGSISLSDLAKQAHQTAEAIAGVGSGEVKGSEALVTVGGGGTSGNGGTITITEGTFNGSDYTYTANTLDLDDFISDLEVDIETYRNAISQIDGQIAALEALKSKPLETFSSSYGTSTGSSSSSSSSSNEDELDEVEEYLADIDEYYKALKRLEAIEIRLSDLSANLEYVDTDQERIILTSQLINLYEDEADALEDLDNLRKNTIRNGVAELESYGFVVSYNDQTNEFVIENMEHLNELEADTQEETNEFRQTVEELIDTLDDLNASNQDDADSLRSLRSEIKSAKQDVIDYLNDIVTAASDVVDMYQNVYDVLHQAADEFAASGFITIDTLQSIIELGPQYMQYLMDENGLLVINEENINKVIAAKTEQMALDQAMTYVDRLELALMEDSIEDLNNLLYATEEATDATWGLVYANLALLDLDEDQYEAALHNINAIRSLATSAVNSIGQVTDSVIDELETMESACGDILKYVIEMLKQQINDEIQALEDMKDAYSDLISLRKESLKAAKEEADYEKNISKQVNEIAKLQAKIDALSLDDSREAQAERASLMEQMAELQEELADTQEEHAIEAQEDALDEMEESYKKEKDEEIAILEDTISSYQKQYDMAIAYIEEHWDTLYEELIAWNYQYGTVLNSEITAAWEACLEAAQRYGSYVNAISANGISADLAAANGTSGTNYVVGVTEYDSGSTDEEMIAAIVTKMYRNSQNWMTASTAEQNELSNENLSLGAQLAQYGVSTHREADGNWYIDDTGELLFDKYRSLINLNKYHSGGIVGGDATTDQKEMLAILQKGEAVLDSTEEESVMSLINFVSVLADKARELNDVVNGIGGVSSGGVNGILPSPEGLAPINETTSSNVNFGSVYIYGANNDTVEKHKEVNRKFVNDVLDVLNIKR